MNTTASHPGHPTRPDGDVYVLSRRGEQALKDSPIPWSVAEVELLVRLDGDCTIAAVRGEMPHCSDRQFTAMFQSLRNRGLIEVSNPDPLGCQLSADVAQWRLVEAGSETQAQRGTPSGRGFSVALAWQRAERRRALHTRPLTALVVEDEPVLARFIKSYLAFEGIQTRMAADRAEVVAELRQLPVPDVILLDVRLPDADGFEILGKLRAHRVFHDTPVIMLTGSASRESLIRGIVAGADGYLTKPFEAESLIRAVTTVLGRKEPEADVLPSDPWTNRDTRQGRDAAAGRAQHAR